MSREPRSIRPGFRWPGDLRTAAAAVAAAAVLLACRSALQTVIDLPPPRPAPPAPPPAVSTLLPTWIQSVDTAPPPPIERTLNPDSVVAQLPRDHAGNVDWVAALRDSIIRPRASLSRQQPPAPPGGFEFAFDFNFPGPDTTFDARFPHSTHTRIVACQQCHPRIFPYRNTPVKMADVFAGKYCGECHGKVAFPVLTGCERCHVRLPQPAGRAKPELIGTITLRRQADSAKGVNLGGGLPAASFPHWVHRIRYQCKVCHLDIFEPRAGANTITMTQIGEGKACGRCHNGSIAFAVGIESCSRCHRQTAVAAR